MENRNRDDMLRRMEAEAEKELLHYYEKNGKQKIKDAVKKAAGRYVAPKDYVFWPTGLLAEALMKGVGEQQLCGAEGQGLKAVEEYFNRWISAGMPIYYVDDVLSGVALLDLYQMTGEGKYRSGADKMAQYLFELADTAADKAGSIPYRPAQGNGHVYVDGVGMMCAFLAKYGAVCNSRRAMNLAVTQMKNMLSYGMDKRTELPYHGFQYENRVKYGIIGWGRAVGWLMMGMAELLCSGQEFLLKEEAAGKTDAEKEMDELAAELRTLQVQFRDLVDALGKFQKKNGAFAWQLEAIEGPEDSSATAMIADALLKVSRLWEENKLANTSRFAEKSELVNTSRLAKESQYLHEGMGDGVMRIAERAAVYLAGCEKEGKIYRCSGECMGFSQYPQVYGAYPWALGPALSLLRGLNGSKE